MCPDLGLVCVSRTLLHGSRSAITASGDLCHLSHYITCRIYDLFGRSKNFDQTILDEFRQRSVAQVHRGLRSVFAGEHFSADRVPDHEARVSTPLKCGDDRVVVAEVNGTPDTVVDTITISSGEERRNDAYSADDVLAPAVVTM